MSSSTARVYSTATAVHRRHGHVLQNEIGVTPSPISSCRSRPPGPDATLGATNVFDEIPDKATPPREISSPVVTTVQSRLIRPSRRSESTALTTTARLCTGSEDQRVSGVGEQKLSHPFSLGGTYLTSWTSISTSMPGATRPATCTVERAGRFGCSLVPKNCV